MQGERIGGVEKGQQRYSNLAVTLHWLIAALIVWNVAVVFLVGENAAPFWMESHKAAGITVLLLSLLRLGWRLTHKWPPLSDELANWEKLLARTTHVLFYVLIILVPLAGWLMVSAGRGQPVSWFGLFDIPPLPVARSAEIAGVFHEVHEYAALTTIGLLVLHVGGALKHSLVGRAPGLSRMWFTRRPARG